MRTIVSLLAVASLLGATPFATAGATQDVQELVGEKTGSECDPTMEPIDWLLCYLGENPAVEKAFYEAWYHTDQGNATTSYTLTETLRLYSSSVRFTNNQTTLTLTFERAAEAAAWDLTGVVVQTGTDSVAYSLAVAKGECRFYAGSAVCDVSANARSSGSGNVGDAFNHCDPNQGLVFYLVCVAVETGNIVIQHYAEVKEGAEAFAGREQGDLSSGAGNFSSDVSGATRTYARGTSSNVDSLDNAAQHYAFRMADHGGYVVEWACDHWTPGQGCPVLLDADITRPRDLVPPLLP